MTNGKTNLDDHIGAELETSRVYMCFSIESRRVASCPETRSTVPKALALVFTLSRITERFAFCGDDDKAGGGLLPQKT